MIRDLVNHRIYDSLRSSRAIVILNDRFSGFRAWLDDLQRGETLHSELSAKRLVGLLIAVDGGYLGQASEVLGSFLVRGLEVLAVAAPRGVEFDDLAGEKRLSILWKVHTEV